MKVVGWGMLAWGLAAMPAVASQLPSVDLEGGRGRLTLGMGAIAADYSPIDRWSVGAMSAVVPLTLVSADVVFGHVGARVGYRAFEAANWSVGVLLSGGVTEATRSGDFFSTTREYGGWVQPALSGAASWPLWRADMRLHLRATLGPSFTYYPNQPGVYVFPLLPNAEAAMAFPGHEVVVGGGSLIAYRWKL